MEHEWHRHIKGREENVYPKDGETVLVKLYDRKTDKYYEIKATFTETEDYRSWNIKIPEGTDIIALPCWWRYDR